MVALILGVGAYSNLQNPEGRQERWDLALYKRPPKLRIFQSTNPLSKAGSSCFPAFWKGIL